MANPMLTDKQIHILQHSLGLSQTGKEYRNRYVPGGEDIETCTELELLGYMTSYETDWIPGRVYEVTDAGKEIARNYYEDKRTTFRKNHQTS